MTTYTLIAVYQVHENYAAHGGFDGSYAWKAKGANEVVVQDNISVTEYSGTKSETWSALVDLATPDSDAYYSYTLIDYQMIELSEDTVERVRKHLDKCAGEELGFVRYQYSTDYAFDWAVKQLQERGELVVTGDQFYSNYELKVAA
ncbi:MAG: hypothetical protein DRJ15_13145 [Bacteroidetes bacterium]|nr:MAG: hypothetical protein DRJ15_13145 [Bacteroidota bacterium]